jgi:ABC-type transport system involved in multi-copper enzyme maturation permease subunit
LGSWGIISVATMAFYLLVALIVKARGGNISPVMWLQGFILHTWALAIIASMGIALSTRLNYDASATLAYIISAVSILLIPRIPVLVATERGFIADIWLFLYNVLPHFEIFDLRRGIVHNFPSVANKLILLCLGYGVCWIVVFLSLAWIAYKNKPFSRVSIE